MHTTPPAFCFGVSHSMADQGPKPGDEAELEALADVSRWPLY